MTKGSRLGPRYRALRDSELPAFSDRVRSQPALPAMVCPAPPDGYPDRDRLDLPHPARCATKCRRARNGRPHGFGLPILPAGRHRNPLRSAGARLSDLDNPGHVSQHAGAAVQQSGGATSRQLRDRPEQGRRGFRRRRAEPRPPVRSCPSGRRATDPTAPTRVIRRATRLDGPGLARALRLVAASGTRGQKVVFWTGPRTFELVIGHLAVATLNRLGYQATLRVVKTTSAGTTGTSPRSSTRAPGRRPASPPGWPDYPPRRTSLRRSSPVSRFSPRARTTRIRLRSATGISTGHRPGCPGRPPIHRGRRTRGGARSTTWSRILRHGCRS